LLQACQPDTEIAQGTGQVGLVRLWAGGGQATEPLDRFQTGQQTVRAVVVVAGSRRFGREVGGTLWSRC